ncbi:MAG: hypothetical protein FWE06_02145 [Oscillospiraceae bacterium]|nr:hypothetical protein [Oscillospiraceae bacterium]
MSGFDQAPGSFVYFTISGSTLTITAPNDKTNELQRIREHDPPNELRR